MRGREGGRVRFFQGMLMNNSHHSDFHAVRHATWSGWKPSTTFSFTLNVFDSSLDDVVIFKQLHVDKKTSLSLLRVVEMRRNVFRLSTLWVSVEEVGSLIPEKMSLKWTFVISGKDDLFGGIKFLMSRCLELPYHTQHHEKRVDCDLWPSLGSMVTIRVSSTCFISVVTLATQE